MGICSDQARVDALRDRYWKIFYAGFVTGNEQAATNLLRWLLGTGGTLVIDVEWLRSFRAVTSVEDEILEQIEKALDEKAKTLPDGAEVTYQVSSSATIRGNPLTELYYASGGSHLQATGRIALARSDDEVAIGGEVTFAWSDPYDWHPGLSAYIPGFGRIEDADAKVLEECAGAREFLMVATWTRRLTGTYDIGIIFDDSSYDWSDP